MKRLPLLASIILLWASNAFAVGIWVTKYGDTYSYNKATTALADAYMTATGIGTLFPGTEGLSLPAYRPGVCYLWQRYDGYRVVGTPFEAWPAGKRMLRVDSSGVYADSGLITPRLGPRSTATTGGAIRIVDGVTFPLTVDGVQQAMNECGASGGGATYVPAASGIPVLDRTLKIPNRVRLIGMGGMVDSIGTFLCSPATNVGAVIENARIDGTQQTAYIENIQIRGDTTAVACSTGIRFRSVYVGSAIRDVLVSGIKGHAIVIDNPGAPVGTIDIENIWINNLDATDGGDGLRIGQTSGTNYMVLPIRLRSIDIERWGIGGAGVRLQGVNCGGASWSRDAIVNGLYLESRADPTATGLHIENFGVVEGNNINLGSGGPLNYLVKIAGAATSGFCGAYGVTLRNMYSGSNGDTILFDQVNNVAYDDTNGGHLYEYRTPSKSPTVIPYMVVTDSIRVNRTANFIGNVTLGTKATAGDSLVADEAVSVTGVSYGVRIGDGTVGAIATNGRLRLYSRGNQDILFETNATMRGYFDDADGHFDVTKHIVAGDSIRANKGLYVGGQFIPKILRASAALDYDLTAATCQDLTITVTGAVTGDDVSVGIPNGSMVTDVTFYGWVSAANTVTIRACDGALAGNPASGTFSVTVIQR